MVYRDLENPDEFVPFRLWEKKRFNLREKQTTVAVAPYPVHYT
jgi:hypothetical protein